MAAPPPCCPRSAPAALMDELVEEILLRIPPDEPLHLFRAAFVCKPWCRILTDPGFLGRYRAVHRAPPPLLGYLHNLGHKNPARIPSFAPTTAASPLSTTLPDPDLERFNWVLDCRHGRVLIHAFKPKFSLVVWNPITGAQKNLSLPTYNHATFAGAVLCAVDGCDHLNCQDGPFKVVFAGSADEGNEFETWVAIYSSETALWSAAFSVHDNCVIKSKPTLLIGDDTLYFSAEYNIILKCDLGAHELSVIESPDGFSQEAVLMELDGGGLGFVCMENDCLHMLSWHGDDANNGTAGGWAQDLVMELKELLPSGGSCPHDVVSFLEGTTTVFICVSRVGLFTLDLKTRKVKRVGEQGPYYAIYPYTGFYTPDLAKGTRHHLHEDAKIDPLP